MNNPFQKWAQAALERQKRGREEPFSPAVRAFFWVAGVFFLIVLVFAIWFAHDAPDFFVLYVPVIFASGYGAVEFLVRAIRGREV